MAGSTSRSIHFMPAVSCVPYVDIKMKRQSVREWVCLVCGEKHDRDINAAKNILAEELRQIG